MVKEKIIMDKERALMINLVTRTKFCDAVLPNLNGRDLSVSYSKLLLKWIKDFYDNNQRAPGNYIKDIYLNNKLALQDDDATSEAISIFLKSLSAESETKKKFNLNYEVKEALSYIDRQRFLLLKEQIADAIESNDIEKAKECYGKFVTCSLSETKELFSRIGSLEVKAPEWIIDGLFETDSTTIIFGDPGAGKSFLALDIGASIACNFDFHTHQTIKSGPVIYICGEGRNTISRRCQAWAVHNNLDLAQFPFYILNTPIQLLDAKSLIPLQNVLKQINNKDGPPVLIIIDTWNRLEGGEENSNSDTAKAFAALDKLSKPYNCSRLIVHHVGVLDKKRARGASALNGAVDTSYMVEKDKNDVIQVTNTKMKDGPLSEPMNFNLVDADIGITDQHGREIHSAVLVYENDYERPRKIAPQGKNQTIAIEKLKELLGNNKYVPIREWRAAVVEVSGMSSSAFSQVKSSLASNKIIYIDGSNVSFRRN